MLPRSGRLAQLVERLPYKQNVGGSIPSAPTIISDIYFLIEVSSAAVVQLVRISACHAEGRGFEPRPLRHSLNTFFENVCFNKYTYT